MLQCFWNSQNPIPVLDQSVARQVGRDASNILTPSSISLMVTLLDSSNSDCISSFHVDVVPGFKSAQNGKSGDQYAIRVDGSGRITLRNRKFLRKFTPAMTLAAPDNRDAFPPLPVANELQRTRPTPTPAVRPPCTPSLTAHQPHASTAMSPPLTVQLPPAPPSPRPLQDTYLQRPSRCHYVLRLQIPCS